MKQVLINLYSINELQPKTKAKVIDKYIEQRKDFSNLQLEEDLTDLLCDELTKKGYTYNEDDLILEYSLNHCQGDGACFTGQLFFTDALENEFTINIYKINHNYSHENTIKLDIEADFKSSRDIDVDDNEVIYNNFIEEAEREIKEICLLLKNKGYEIANNQIDDEKIEYEIMELGYLFLSDGTLFDADGEGVQLLPDEN